MTKAHRESAELERVILGLLSQRSAQGFICPSDTARAARPEGWRALMDEVRAAARRPAVRGEVDISQGGRVVDIAAAGGRCGSAGTGRIPFMPSMVPRGPPVGRQSGQAHARRCRPGTAAAVPASARYGVLQLFRFGA